MESLERWPGRKNYIFTLMRFLDTPVQIQGQGTQNYVLVHFNPNLYNWLCI